MFSIKSLMSFFTGMIAPAAVAFTLSSPDFNEAGKIPTQFTCHGDNVAPTLTWSHAPKETQSFVLTMEDPDAPHGTFIHWVLFNIPASIDSLNKDSKLGTGGMNTAGKTTYTGPCPPSGVHHYIFTLYALNKMLDIKEGASLGEVKQGLRPYVLAESKLVGIFP